MTNPTITAGEAVALINDSILNFEDGLSSEVISNLIYSINNELQIRDYLLGLPATFPMDTCKSFLMYLASSVDGAERYSLETVLSGYFYETEDLEMSIALLTNALDTKSDYSLANLIQRVIKAGWEPSSFRQMREELHPKVVGMLEEMADQLI